MPHFFLVELFRKMNRPFPSFQQFLTFGYELICCLQNNRKVSQNYLPPPPPPLPPPAVRASKTVSTPLVSTSGCFSCSKDERKTSDFQASYISSKKVASTCKYCGDYEHSSLKCTKVVSHNARVETAKKKACVSVVLALVMGGGGLPGDGGGRLDIESFLSKSRSHTAPLYKKACT